MRSMEERRKEERRSGGDAAVAEITFKDGADGGYVVATAALVDFTGEGAQFRMNGYKLDVGAHVTVVDMSGQKFLDEPKGARVVWATSDGDGFHFGCEYDHMVAFRY